jgi:crossover junction endodeoxyribonuclease RusA
MGTVVVEDVCRDTSIKNKRLYLNLGLPVSVNELHYWAGSGRGKRLTGKALNYMRDSRALINLAMEEQRWSMVEDKTWLYVDCVFYFPDRRIRDSHNMLKLLLDVMQGYVYSNDYTVLPRIQSVEYDKESPRVELCITPQTSASRSKGLKVTNNPAIL